MFTNVTPFIAVVITQQIDTGSHLFPNGVVHDFGTVERGTLLNHRFRLVNRFDVPLKIVDVRLS